MRKLALFASFLALATAAAAQGRPYAPALSCQQAASLVAAQGAVVLGTGPYTYERIVVHRGFCPIEETTAPAWVPTTNDPRCFVGYRCKDKFNEGRGRD
jgi:hypothetical protein